MPELYRKNNLTVLDSHFNEILEEIRTELNNSVMNEILLNTIQEKYFTESSWDMYIVSAIRFLTSYGYQKNHDEFSAFLEVPMTGRQFAQTAVENQGQDADQIQIMALCKVLPISLTVVYVDLTPGDQPNYHHFNENYRKSSSHINLLYRPGHYDLLV